MKKIIIYFLVLSLLLCGCQNNSQEDLNSEDPVIYDGDKVYFEGYGAYQEYLVYRDNIPKYHPTWEQFSALGKYDTAHIWAKIPDKNVYAVADGRYTYRYIDPVSNEVMYYDVEFCPLGEGTDYTLRDSELRHYRMMSEELVLVDYDPLWFVDGDFTKFVGQEDVWCVLNDELMIMARAESIKNGYHSKQGLVGVAFIYDNVYYSIGKTGGGGRFDSAIECDIIRRLMNADTYKEAIKELMNPENAK